MAHLHIVIDDQLSKRLRSEYGHGEVASLVRDYLAGLVSGRRKKVLTDVFVPEGELYLRSSDAQPSPADHTKVLSAVEEKVEPAKRHRESVPEMNPMMKKFLEQNGKKA